MKEESQRLKDRFVAEMQGRIFSGELKPGDKLPPERDLASAFGISRSCINQGILDMERAGFLRIVPRKGTFVADYIGNATPQTLAAIMSYDSALYDSKLFKDLMDMRILIERECVRMACHNVNTSSLEALYECTDRIFTSEREILAKTLYDYHLCLVHMSGNSAYSMIFQSFEKVLKNLIGAHYHNEPQMKKCLPMYENLTRAVSKGDVAEADKQISMILGIASDYLNELLSQS